MTAYGYRNLIVWQKAIDLVIAVYELTAQFPSSERFGLASQLQRATVSIASNIAEGSKRGTKKDFRQFLQISFGSGAEVETQIEIVKRLPWSKEMNFLLIDQLLDDVMRLLNRLIQPRNVFSNDE